MRLLYPTILASTLMLAGCGDQAQQAQAPGPDRDGDGRTAQTTVPQSSAPQATPPTIAGDVGGQRQAGSPAPNVATAPATTGSITTPNAQQPATPPATPSATPQPGPIQSGTANSGLPAGSQPTDVSRQTAAAPDRIAPALAGRTFTSGQTWVQFSSDNRFILRDLSSDRTVRGNYALEGNRITFSNPQGDTGGMTFPLTCSIRQSSPEGFALEQSNCGVMSGLTFRAQAS